MPKLSPINSKELVGILKKQGFEIVHQKGSHLRLKHLDGRSTTVPIHSGEKVGVGLLRKILRDVHISRHDFEKLR